MRPSPERHEVNATLRPSGANAGSSSPHVEGKNGARGVFGAPASGTRRSWCRPSGVLNASFAPRTESGSQLKKPRSAKTLAEEAEGPWRRPVEGDALVADHQLVPTRQPCDRAGASPFTTTALPRACGLVSPDRGWITRSDFEDSKGRPRKKARRRPSGENVGKKSAVVASVFAVSVRFSPVSTDTRTMPQLDPSAPRSAAARKRPSGDQSSQYDHMS